jgi:7,8-dihydropterin-6-yl-methyl-4-(beta-D-ribofuranosyl)aminobenzene 5'-phosphate synthase
MRLPRISQPGLALSTMSVMLMMLLWSCQHNGWFEPKGISQSKTAENLESTSLPVHSISEGTQPLSEIPESSAGDGDSTSSGESSEEVIGSQRDDQLKITIVYDNNDYDPDLDTAWGFSCLVEGLEKNILFDTGGNADLLLRNMQILEIDPGIIDIIILSHIHDDHVGGLAGFLEENNNVTVYLLSSFPESLKTSLREGGTEVVEVDEEVEVIERAYSTGELGTSIKEQSLIIETEVGLVVITGCAHPGIVNIVRHAKEMMGQQVYLVLGGFHLRDTSEIRINEIVDEFKILGVQKVAPCHCTGDRALQVFSEAYESDFIINGVGMVLLTPR